MNTKLTFSVGVAMVLIALLTAMGSVSIGSASSSTSSGAGTAIGLVYSTAYEFLSVVFAGLGMALIYFAGKEQTLPSAT